MTLPRRWWLWAGCVVVVVVLGVGLTVWVQRPNPLVGKVSVDVSAPVPLSLGKGGHGSVTVTVTNESGDELTNAELRVAIRDPGGDYPSGEFSSAMFDEECGIEDPGVEPECVKAEKRAKRQSCQTAQETGTDVICDGAIAEGDDEYVFSFSMMNLPTYEYVTGVEDFPDPTFRAVVLVDGQRIATDTVRQPVELPDEFRRIDVDGLPTDMAIDDPSSRVHEWSFRVVNDTDTDVVDATISMRMSTNDHVVDIGTARSGCERESSVGPAHDIIECPDVDIPAGAELTVDMRMNVADGAVSEFGDVCPSEPSDADDCLARAAQGVVFIFVKTDDTDTFASTRQTVTLLVDD